MNKERAYALLKSIWPTIHRIITRFLYFLISLIKGSIKLALEQFKGTF